MRRLVFALTIFISILSQMLFWGEDTVVYASLISTSVIIPFVITMIQTKNVYFSYMTKMYTILVLYLIISVLWNEFGHAFNVNNIRTLLLTDIFIVVLYNILKQENCNWAVRWPFIICIYVNSLLFVFPTSFQIFGDVGSYIRFQGTFSNPNAAAMAFFAGVVFCIFEFRNENFLASVLAYMGIPIGTILILATASKKGITAIAILLIFALPIQLRKIKPKQLFIALSAVVLIATFVGIRSEELGIAESYKNAVQRYDLLFQETSASGYDIDKSTGDRIYFIQSGLEKFFDSPIFGHGLDSFRSYHDGYVSHSNYIELLFNGGLIAFFLYYSIYVHAFKIVLRLRDRYTSSLLIIVLFTMLLSDVALISYDSKIMIYILFCLVYFAEEQKELNEKYMMVGK